MGFAGILEKTKKKGKIRNKVTERNPKDWCIYALQEPNFGPIRYVGFTSIGMIKRVIAHVSESRGSRGDKNKKCQWIRELLARGEFPTILNIESGSGPSWAERENWWIEKLREIYGDSLTNSKRGGAGNNMTEEVRAKISLSKKGKKLSAEHRAKISLGGRGRKSPHSEETKINIGLGNIGKRRSPEVKLKLSAVQIKRNDANARLTEDQVAIIYMRLSRREKRRIVAEDYGVSTTIIDKIRAKKYKRTTDEVYMKYMEKENN